MKWKKLKASSYHALLYEYYSKMNRKHHQESHLLLRRQNFPSSKRSHAILAFAQLAIISHYISLSLSLLLFLGYIEFSRFMSIVWLGLCEWIFGLGHLLLWFMWVLFIEKIFILLEEPTVNTKFRYRRILINIHCDKQKQDNLDSQDAERFLNNKNLSTTIR